MNMGKYCLLRQILFYVVVLLRYSLSVGEIEGNGRLS